MRFWAACFVISAALSTSAAAQDHVARGIELYGDADFPGALRAFEQAAQGDGLTRASLVELLRYRALSYHALRNGAAMAATMESLAAVTDGPGFGERHPPSVHEAFDRARQNGRRPLALEPRVTSTDNGIEVKYTSQGQPVDFIRAIRVYARHVGSNEWRTAADQVQIPRATTVEYYAELVGPGGVVFLQDASRDAPHAFSLTPTTPPDTSTVPAPEPVATPTRRRTGLWVALGLAGAAAIAVTTGLALSSGGGGPTQVSGPMAEFP